MTDRAEADRFQRGVQQMFRSAVGGAIVTAPALTLVALGAPSAVTTSFLVLAVVVLSIVAIRQRHGRSRK